MNRKLHKNFQTSFHFQKHHYIDGVKTVLIGLDSYPNTNLNKQRITLHIRGRSLHRDTCSSTRQELSRTAVFCVDGLRSRVHTRKGRTLSCNDAYVKTDTCLTPSESGVSICGSQTDSGSALSTDDVNLSHPSFDSSSAFNDTTFDSEQPYSECTGVSVDAFGKSHSFDHGNDGRMSGHHINNHKSSSSDRLQFDSMGEERDDLCIDLVHITDAVAASWHGKEFFHSTPTKPGSPILSVFQGTVDEFTTANSIETEISGITPVLSNSIFEIHNNDFGKLLTDDFGKHEEKNMSLASSDFPGISVPECNDGTVSAHNSEDFGLTKHPEHSRVHKCEEFSTELSSQHQVASASVSLMDEFLQTEFLSNDDNSHDADIFGMGSWQNIVNNDQLSSASEKLKSAMVKDNAPIDSIDERFNELLSDTTNITGSIRVSGCLCKVNHENAGHAMIGFGCDSLQVSSQLHNTHQHRQTNVPGSFDNDRYLTEGDLANNSNKSSSSYIVNGIKKKEFYEHKFSLPEDSNQELIAGEDVECFNSEFVKQDLALHPASNSYTVEKVTESTSSQIEFHLGEDADKICNYEASMPDSKEEIVKANTVENDKHYVYDGGILPSVEESRGGFFFSKCRKSLCSLDDSDKNYISESRILPGLVKDGNWCDDKNLNQDHVQNDLYAPDCNLNMKSDCLQNAERSIKHSTATTFHKSKQDIEENNLYKNVESMLKKHVDSDMFNEILQSKNQSKPLQANLCRCVEPKNKYPNTADSHNFGEENKLNFKDDTASNTTRGICNKNIKQDVMVFGKSMFSMLEDVDNKGCLVTSSFLSSDKKNYGDSSKSGGLPLSNVDGNFQHGMHAQTENIYRVQVTHSNNTANHTNLVYHMSDMYSNSKNKTGEVTSNVICSVEHNDGQQVESDKNDIKQDKFTGYHQKLLRCKDFQDTRKDNNMIHGLSYNFRDIDNSAVQPNNLHVSERTSCLVDDISGSITEGSLPETGCIQELTTDYSENVQCFSNRSISSNDLLQIKDVSDVDNKPKCPVSTVQNSKEGFSVSQTLQRSKHVEDNQFTLIDCYSKENSKQNSSTNVLSHLNVLHGNHGDNLLTICKDGVKQASFPGVENFNNGNICEKSYLQPFYNRMQLDSSDNISEDRSIDFLQEHTNIEHVSPDGDFHQIMLQKTLHNLEQKSSFYSLQCSDAFSCDLTLPNEGDMTCNIHKDDILFNKLLCDIGLQSKSIENNHPNTVSYISRKSINQNELESFYLELYLAYTKELVENFQNHACPVCEDYMPTYRFKRYLHKNHNFKMRNNKTFRVYPILITLNEDEVLDNLSLKCSADSHQECIRRRLLKVHSPSGSRLNSDVFVDDGSSRLSVSESGYETTDTSSRLTSSVQSTSWSPVDSCSVLSDSFRFAIHSFCVFADILYMFSKDAYGVDLALLYRLRFGHCGVQFGV